ncbi:MAG: hypothetical protein E7302_13435 [Butyrivibrio sp.]|nr:hypothetical protein [Butyrivibrio sp.]
MRFRETLQKALEEGLVCLPENVEADYEPVEDAYRMIKLNTEKTVITEDDFRTQAEIPAIAQRSDFDKSDIGNYGCSFFNDENIMKLVLKLPRKNKGIAKGIIYSKYGMLQRGQGNSHFMCFIYEGVTLSEGFEVVEE